MAGKKQTPAPIDRPISRAYLREFSGWSTAYPPGASEPTSLRVMENVMVNRDGSVRIRPALRYLSYQDTGAPLAATYKVVGTHESFYLDDGSKALLVALRDTSAGDGIFFAVFKYNEADTASPFEYMTLTDAGFTLPTDPGTISFTAATTYVKYVQIDNKILALSDAGEGAVLFHVGETKKAVRPQALPGPTHGGPYQGGTVIDPEHPEWGEPPLIHHMAAAALTDGSYENSQLIAQIANTTTLVSSDPSANVYTVLAWYTFANEFGESIASWPAQIKVQRPWSQWKMVNGSGQAVTNPQGSIDQIVVWISSTFWDANKAAGATHLNVYAASYQPNVDPQPVEGILVAHVDISDKEYLVGWGGSQVTITPAIDLFATTAPVPNSVNRKNYSEPPTSGQGIVASDRLVTVYDPLNAAVIKWTSNLQGDYLNFSAVKGGGFKTLTSGNMQIPACVKLWQNPQSVDTLTILCKGTDGHSTGYYMAPAQVAQQSEATNFMGFEETTATPGTTSPFGCEVANNALYHPLDTELMKSTASNYNINHKAMTDTVANVWASLVDKHKIVSSVHDNRIYYIVHNPGGDDLEAGCMGNEIWVLDIQAKTPTWSRWLIQACSLRAIEVEGRIYMSVVRPDGIFYLDPDSATDHVVTAGALVSQAIPWKLETNTQGANRAHDAWCRLVQLSIQVGFFQGQMRYGVKGYDRNGQVVDKSKIIRDAAAPSTEAWDLEDYLQVQREMKEWFFYAESVETGGVVQASAGQISLVQYRYTPISVNVGYAYGSVETFEYGIAGNAEADRTTVNGVPMPYLDTRRP